SVMLWWCLSDAHTGVRQGKVGTDSPAGAPGEEMTAMGARNWISRLPARLLEIAALPRWIRQLGVHAREARSAPLPPLAVHLVALLGRLDLHAGFVVDIGAGDG